MEDEGLATNQVDAADGWAPVTFDVLDDQISATEMVNFWGHLGVVHGVSHVTHQDHVLADIDHLPDTEGSTEHAHIEMHADQDDVGDPSFCEQVVYFLTVVADGVSVIDANRFNLTGPCVTDGALDGAVTTHV